MYIYFSVCIQLFQLNIFLKVELGQTVHTYTVVILAIRKVGIIHISKMCHLVWKY